MKKFRYHAKTCSSLRHFAYRKCIKPRSVGGIELESQSYQRHPFTDVAVHYGMVLSGHNIPGRINDGTHGQ
jgi:hypothetical protein